MCGINGCTGSHSALVERMNKETNHRGPDGTGLWAGKVTLGHNRLAIIDLSEGGKQPMASHDGRFTITYNGELYNYRDIKKELPAYPFRSESDTEVILAAWERWGVDCLSRFNGMFAFALWDEREETLYLVRDPVGIKPLYYLEKDNELFFSSEIKALLETGITRKLNRDSLNLYFRFLYTPGPTTMFESISRIQPGQVLKYRRGEISLSTYQAYEREIFLPADRTDRAHKLWEVLKGGVSRQLVSDRPVGLYLSGGLDSNAILAALFETGHKLKTFSVGFELEEGEQKEKFNADLELAKRAAAQFGVEHHSVLFSATEVIPYLEKAVWHLDDPNWNPTSLSMLKLAEFTKPQVAVALAGDGGDELFGGYERYRKSHQLSLLRRIPLFSKLGLLNKKLKPLSTEEGGERFAWFMLQTEDTVQAILEKGDNNSEPVLEYLSNRFPTVEKSFEKQFMAVDRKNWLVDEALLRTDKMGMAAGLEVRVPLLDLELLSFADRLSQSDLISSFDKKILYKEALRGHVPEFLLSQEKRGWFSPAAKWLRRPDVAAFAREVLSPSFYVETKSLFNWHEIERLRKDHQQGGYHLQSLWSLLVFQLWAKAFSIKT